MRVDEIRRELVVEAPIEQVWEALTTPEHLRKWFGDSAEVDLRPGGRAGSDGRSSTIRRRRLSRSSTGRHGSHFAGKPFVTHQSSNHPPLWSSVSSQSVKARG